MNQPRWDVSFENVHYSVCGWIAGEHQKRREILRGLSGEFRGNELSAILGQSGSGKSTLLNLLSGYTKCNVSGAIKINGHENIRAIRRRSRYITQDYHLHHFITVREAMNFAANLKCSGLSKTCLNYKTTTILDDLGLSKKVDHYSGDLSGGEVKRLLIAMELIDDPMILFLDEPTTGLDSSSSVQCIQLLKRLAKEGRTIVCTIHTPSALLFKMLDHIYAVADGCCIYQGSSKGLLPFLNDLNLKCRDTYNPADFLLEIANNDYGHQNHRLTEKTRNGLDCYDRHPSNEATCRLLPLHSQPSHRSTYLLNSFGNQLKQLIMRTFLINCRDKTLCIMRLTVHFVIAVFIGIIYNGVGDDAAHLLNIYKFLFFNIFLLMFTAFSSLQTCFPLNLPITKRECFNGWYTPAAYTLAMSISDIPMVVVTNFIYISMTYLMTNQPMELNRFVGYYTVILLLSLTAQGLGLIAGSILNVKFTLIVGSFLMCPFVLFSNFFVHMKDTQPFWHWIFEMSFIKHALDGSMVAILGYNRKKMTCESEYCHFTWPHKFLDFLGITESLPAVLMKLIAFAFVFRAIAFVVMWYRLKH